MVTVSWSLQRVRHGEQAPWMGLTLAAMLGQIGLPGGGFGHGYGSQNEVGMAPLRCRLPTFPQGLNPVTTFIPVAAVSDMLLHPGERVRLQRAQAHLPGHQVRLLGRRKSVPPPPEPATAAAGAGPGRHRGRARPVLDGDGQARRHRRAVDHAVRTRRLLRLAQRPAAGGDAGDGRAVRAVPRRLHDVRRTGRPTRLRRAVHRGPHRATVAARTCTRSGRPDSISTVPSFDEFWAAGSLRLPTEPGLTLLADFRADPVDPPAGHAQRAHRDLLPGHRRIRLRRLRGPPAVVRAGRMARRRRAAERYPLHLLANQPATRAAQPARRRRHQSGVESARARTHPHHIRPMRSARAVRRRRGAGLQRPRCLPGRRRRRRPSCAPAWSSCRPARGTTRRPGDPDAHVRTRQPQRAHRRRRHVLAGAAAAPARTSWCRSRSSTVRCRRCGRTSRPGSSTVTNSSEPDRIRIAADADRRRGGRCRPCLRADRRSRGHHGRKIRSRRARHRRHGGSRRRHPRQGWPAAVGVRGGARSRRRVRARTRSRPHLLRLGRDARLAQQLLGVPALFGQHDGHHVARAAGARGAAGAVQVRLVLGRRIDVDDEFDVVDVHAAGGDVGGDEHAGLAGAERGEVAVAGRLRQVAVQVDRRHAGLGELLGQLAGLVLGAHEQDPTSGPGRERVRRGAFLASTPATWNTWWVIAAAARSISSTECSDLVRRKRLTSLSTPLSRVAENSSR